MPDLLLTRRSVADQTSDAIRTMILGGRLRPGDALPAERQLAIDLKVSRPTVRQAISSLTAMNILESRHGGGTFVTQLSPRQLSAPLRFLLQVAPAAERQLLQTRELLEPGIIGLAAEQASADELDQVRVLVGTERTSVDDSTSFTTRYLDVHRTLTSTIDNAIAVLLTLSVLDLCEPTLNTVFSDADRCRAVVAEHEEILAACRSRDAALAESRTRKHLNALLEFEEEHADTT